MKPLVISFFTLGTAYQKEAEKLRSSCEKYHIEHEISGITSKGSWERNCALKPEFILKKLYEWNRPMLWVDADAVFLKRATFKEFEDIDFSVRVNEFLPKTHESRIASGTVFVRNNDDGINVLRKWKELSNLALENSQRTTEFWDQIALRDVLNHEAPVRFLPMPLKYVKIFDFDDLFISEEEVVIEHYQASRRHKYNETSSHHCCH